MLKLEALVKPAVIDEVLRELIELGVHSLSYSEVYASNQELFHPVQGRDVPEDVAFVPHIKLEVILDKGHLPAVENALAKHVASPMQGGAELTVVRLKEGLRILATSQQGDPEVREI